MSYTYAIKWEGESLKKVLVTSSNINDLKWYTFIQQKTLDPRDQAYEDFNNSLKVIENQYTAKEREAFERELAEAKKYIETWESAFLAKYTKEWETVEELANKILENNEIFENVWTWAKKKLREDLEKINT